MLVGIEKEVVVLKAVKELVDSIVNFEVLRLGDNDPTEIRFNSITHSKYFNIVLVDFLSASDKELPFEPQPYLRALKEITETPAFNVDDSVTPLRIAVTEFAIWLNDDIVINKLWLPTISTEVDLQIKRLDLLKVAGNICRHNILRAAGIAGTVKKILEQNNITVDQSQVLLALGDVHEWFHNHIFSYHSGTIAEFLNNIRWGIFNYLRAEFTRSIVWESHDPPKYRYTYPPNVIGPFAKECYWELMNEVCSQPYMRQFQISPYLKMRY
jgi:hypothetical protein